jgi:hypothetical protein
VGFKPLLNSSRADNYWCSNYLTNILNNLLLTIMLAQIQLQSTAKQLKQHLKADLSDSRVVATLAKLITDKSI